MTVSVSQPSGEKLEGPSKRGLDPLEAQEVEGRVQVRFARFRPKPDPVVDYVLRGMPAFGR